MAAEVATTRPRGGRLPRGVLRVIPVNRIDLDGRVAVVTGGSGGLGRAIVQRLLDSGARHIAILDLARAALSDRRTSFHEIDITDPNRVDASIQQIVRTHGTIDILINSAGVQGPVAPVSQVSSEEWQRVIAVNLTGTFHCSRAVVPTMTAAKWGRIVMISSVQAKEGTKHAGAYAASKAGQIALAKVMAKELATTGVTVNCVTPTVVDTGMFDEIGEDRRQELLQRIPMGRYCSAAEVAAMVTWIASDDCSFSTGAVFDLSGGRATW